MSKFGKNAESSYKGGSEPPADNNVLKLQFPSTPAEAQQRVNDLLTDGDSPLAHRNAANAKFDAAGNKGQVLAAVLQEFAKAENLADRLSGDRARIAGIQQAIENDKRYVKAERSNGIWHAYDQTLKDLLDSSAVVRISHALRLLETARTEGTAEQRQQLNKQATNLLVDATRFDRNITEDPRVQAKIAEQLKKYQGQGGIPADLKQDLSQCLRQIDALQNGQNVPMAQARDAQTVPAAQTEAPVGDRVVRNQQPANGQRQIPEATQGWLAVDLAQQAVQTYTDALNHGARPVDALAMTEKAFQDAMLLAGNVHDIIHRTPVSDFQRALDPAQESNLSPHELAVVRQFKNGLDPITGQSCSKTELAKRAEMAYHMAYTAPEMVRTLHSALILKTAELLMRQVQPNSADYNKCVRDQQLAAYQLKQLADLNTLALPGALLNRPSDRDEMIQYAQIQLAADATTLHKPVLAAVSPTAPAAQDGTRSLNVPPVGYNKNTFTPKGAPPAPGIAPESGNRVGENRLVSTGATSAPDAGNKVGDNQPAKPLTAQEHLQMAVNEYRQTKNINHQEFQLAIQQSHAAIVDQSNMLEGQRDKLIAELNTKEAARATLENKIGDKASTIVDSEKQLQTIQTQLQRAQNTQAQLAADVNADRTRLEADKKADQYFVANFFHKFDHTDIDTRQAALDKKQAQWEQCTKQIRELRASADVLNKSIKADKVDAGNLAKQIGDIVATRRDIKNCCDQLNQLRIPTADVMYKYGTALVAAGAVGAETQKLLVNAGAYDPKLLDSDDFKQALQKSGLDAVATIKNIRDAQDTKPHPFTEAHYAFDALPALGYEDSKNGLQRAINNSGPIDAERLHQLELNLQRAAGKPEQATAQMDLLAPYMSRLAMAAAAKQNGDTTTFNSMLQQINAAAIPASIQPVISKSIEYAKQGKLISEKQILEPIQAVRSVQPNQGKEVVLSGSATGVIGNGGGGKTKGPDVLGVAKDTTLQVGGDIGTGWLGWASTPVIAGGLTTAAAMAAEAGLVITAPAWVVPAAIGTVAVVGGVAITIGAKSLYNNLTNTGEKDWHKSMCYDAFNYGTFGAGTAVKFVGKQVAKTAVVDAVLREAPAIGQTIARFGWIGKDAQEVAVADHAAKQAIEAKAKAAVAELVAKAQQKYIPAGAQEMSLHAQQITKRAAEMLRNKILREEAARLAKAKEAELLVAGIFGTPKPALLKLSGAIQYAGNVAKQVPVALATSATYAYGKYKEDLDFHGLNQDQAGSKFASNLLWGTVGGSVVGPVGNAISKSEFVELMGGHVKTMVGDAFQPVTSFINRTPILNSVSLDSQLWATQIRPYDATPAALRAMTIQGTDAMITNTAEEVLKVVGNFGPGPDDGQATESNDQPTNSTNQAADPTIGSPNTATPDAGSQPTNQDSNFPLNNATSEVSAPAPTNDQAAAVDSNATAPTNDQPAAVNPNAQAQTQDQTSAGDPNAQGQTQVSPGANAAGSDQQFPINNSTPDASGNASPDTSNQGAAPVGP